MEYPRQGNVGKRVRVCFDYDTTKSFCGVLVRDDIEEPFQTIVRLDSGNYVLATECQYSFDGAP